MCVYEYKGDIRCDMTSTKQKKAEADGQRCVAGKAAGEG